MKILLIGAHADDIELNCGGTILKKIAEGHEVRCVALSYCNNQELQDECVKALSILGVTKVKFGEFPVRYFPNHRQQILDFLIQIRDSYQPDLVVTHNVHDRHQDHCAVGGESMRAFRDQSMLTYVSQINRITGAENYFICLDEKQMVRKVDAIKCYQSQAKRTYCDPEVIFSTARIAGLKICSGYAEGFEVVKMIS